ncbi:MAG: hypothetical protein AABX05_02735, partial [Nanoarchaeota archaeon]
MASNKKEDLWFVLTIVSLSFFVFFFIDGNGGMTGAIPTVVDYNIESGLIIENAQSISSLILNTTNLLLNDTTVNLTVYNVSSNATKIIYNWQVNGNSLAMLNMPFERNNSDGNNTRDYSGHITSGTTENAAVWNATGG